MSVIRILYVEDDLDFGRMTKVFLDQGRLSGRIDDKC